MFPTKDWILVCLVLKYFGLSLFSLYSVVLDENLFLGSCQNHVTARLESLINGRFFMTVVRDSLDGQTFGPRISFRIGIWKNLYLCRE